MGPLPEGVTGYPRWDGELRGGPAFPTIAAEEVTRASKGFWGQLVFGVAIVYTLLYLGRFYAAGEASHTMENFLLLVHLLPWAAIGVASVIAGPSLLEDARHRSLELYLSRAVTKGDYLFGKTLAVFGSAFAVVFVPILLYWVAGYAFFDAQPEQWEWIALGGLGFALLWATLVTALGMGLSVVSRSSRAASLLLFGLMAVADGVVSNLLEAITRDAKWQIVSPVAALQVQEWWLFSVPDKSPFPYWWGLVEWGALAAIGILFVVWRHPRIGGE
ncbi:MAG: ABC transporter permease [Methanobacteriota archaeon]